MNAKRALEILKKYKDELQFKSKTYEQLVESPEGIRIVQLKMDGELQALVHDKKDTFLVSITGRRRKDLPVVEEARRRLQGKGDSLFFGELYVVDERGRNIPYPQAVSILRKPEKKDLERIKLAVFDVYQFQGKRVQDDYPDRFLLVQEIFDGGKLVAPVASAVGPSALKKLWNKVTRENYEGVVVYTDDIIKVKPKFTVDLAVIGMEEATESSTGKPKGVMGALHLAFMDKDGNFLYAGKCGTGFTDLERKSWWQWGQRNRVEGPEKPARFRHTLWVRPKRVVEVEYQDVNKKEQTPLIFSRGRYTWAEEKEEAISLRFPKFVRLREDKRVRPRDVRLEQVPEIKEAMEIDPSYKKSDEVSFGGDLGSELLMTQREEPKGVAPVEVKKKKRQTLLFDLDPARFKRRGAFIFSILPEGRQIHRPPKNTALKSQICKSNARNFKWYITRQELPNPVRMQLDYGVSKMAEVPQVNEQSGLSMDYGNTGPFVLLTLSKYLGTPLFEKYWEKLKESALAGEGFQKYTERYPPEVFGYEPGSAELEIDRLSEELKEAVLNDRQEEAIALAELILDIIYGKTPIIRQQAFEGQGISAYFVPALGEYLNEISRKGVWPMAGEELWGTTDPALASARARELALRWGGTPVVLEVLATPEEEVEKEGHRVFLLGEGISPNRILRILPG